MSMANILPAIFFGHGNPMNAVTHNDYTETWRRMGVEIPKPKAILSISAHWYVPESPSAAHLAVTRTKPAPSQASTRSRIG